MTASTRVANQTAGTCVIGKNRGAIIASVGLAAALALPAVVTVRRRRWLRPRM